MKPAEFQEVFTHFLNFNFNRISLKKRGGRGTSSKLNPSGANIKTILYKKIKKSMSVQKVLNVHGRNGRTFFFSKIFIKIGFMNFYNSVLNVYIDWPHLY